MDITINNAILVLKKYLKNPTTMDKFEHSICVSRYVQNICPKMERFS